MNQVGLVGEIVGAPFYQTTERSAADFTKFHLYTGDQAEKIQHLCIAWGPMAILLHTHLRPGSMLAIRGRLQYHRFKNWSGSQIEKPEIIVEGFTFLDGR